MNRSMWGLAGAVCAALLLVWSAQAPRLALDDIIEAVEGAGLRVAVQETAQTPWGEGTVLTLGRDQDQFLVAHVYRSQEEQERLALSGETGTLSDRVPRPAFIRHRNVLIVMPADSPVRETVRSAILSWGMVD
ncbi:MAG: hypothetical protein LOD90_06620 [Symbiobacteriaceae bacterium]|nr:MAG: hypothetical protein DIU55_05555 [Bacillota bacterium]